MQIRDYLNAIKEIKEISEAEDLQLTSDMVVAVVQEWGKDKRTQEIETGKDKRVPRQPQQDNKEPERMASTKQKELLQKLRVKTDFAKLTFAEADRLIKANIKKDF